MWGSPRPARATEPAPWLGAFLRESHFPGLSYLSSRMTSDLALEPDSQVPILVSLSMPLPKVSSILTTLMSLERHHFWRMSLGCPCASPQLHLCRGAPLPKALPDCTGVPWPVPASGTWPVLPCGTCWARVATPLPHAMHVPSGLGAVVSDLGPCVLEPAQLLGCADHTPDASGAFGSRDCWGFHFLKAGFPLATYRRIN